MEKKLLSRTASERGASSKRLVHAPIKNTPARIGTLFNPASEGGAFSKRTAHASIKNTPPAGAVQFSNRLAHALIDKCHRWEMLHSCFN